MRTLIGTIVLALFMFSYIVGVVWLASRLVEERGILLQTGYYVVAGIVWTWPAMKIILWMRKAL